MTIELITGNPGSGKTTYGVAVRLSAELERSIPLEPDACLALGLDVGASLKRRLVVGGVNGLVVDHERIPHTLTREPVSEPEIEFWNRLEDGEPCFKRLPGQPAWTHVEFENARRDNEKRPGEWFRPTLFNWWLWAKPGDLIFVDEIQFIVPRGSLSKKPPLWIALLEIHRHYGIDCIFLTQHPQLLDTTIRNLVGLHRHVRPVMGSPLCMVYVWDHASNPERYQLASKSMWRRKRADYRLFRSSSAHIAPPTAGRRTLLMLLPIALVVGVALVHFRDRFGGKGSSPISAAQAAGLPLRGAVPAAAGSAVVLRVAGCYAVGDRCKCQSQDGLPVPMPVDACHRASSSFEGVIQWQPRAAPLQTAYGAAAKGQPDGSAVVAEGPK